MSKISLMLINFSILKLSGRVNHVLHLRYNIIYCIRMDNTLNEYFLC